MKAKVYITLKDGVLDPQGKAITNALDHLGFEGVESVRQGKLIEVELHPSQKENADEVIAAMCEKLLANTVIENYRYELEA